MQHNTLPCLLASPPALCLLLPAAACCRLLLPAAACCCLLLVYGAQLACLLLRCRLPVHLPGASASRAKPLGQGGQGVPGQVEQAVAGKAAAVAAALSQRCNRQHAAGVQRGCVQRGAPACLPLASALGVPPWQGCSPGAGVLQTAHGSCTAAMCTAAAYMCSAQPPYLFPHSSSGAARSLAIHHRAAGYVALAEGAALQESHVQTL